MIALDAASKRLPFSSEEFFDVFVRYNEAVWPMPIVLVGLAALAAAAAFAGTRWSREIGSLLGFLWCWMAIAYHAIFFTRINPLAWVFAAAFLAAGVLFARHALRGTLRFDGSGSWVRAVGATLVVYAIAGYPLVGIAAGHAYPRAPTFGLPCPTTIFTLGMLLLATRPVPLGLFVVPLGWAIVGGSAAALLGVVQDFGLPVAAIAVVATLVAERSLRSPTQPLRRRRSNPR